jgi:DNA polymerase I-like protein with 3'-5' exonuclease and polymerase domains
LRRIGEKKSTYYAYGHPEGNNIEREKAHRILRDLYRSGEPLLFQNGKFDVDVALVHHQLKVPSWEKIHDTLYQIFLHDPHADTFSLKPSAQRILGIKPEEQDRLKEWIIKNVPEARKKKSEWGAYICRAPGTLVAPYANGDNVRAGKLHQYLWPRLQKRGMQQAYDRERHLMPILLRNEREGVRCNVRELEKDFQIYTVALESADAWLRKRLKAPNMNLDSGEEFADALEAAGVVTEFTYTSKGNRSVSKKNLTVDMFEDAKVAAVYGYRGRLSTCLGNFMTNWLRMAHANNGIVNNNWNQVRGPKGAKDTSGARTGRMSCDGSGFMNSPKNWKKARAEGYVYPAFVKMHKEVNGIRKGEPVPDLPLMRRYFMPDKGCTWGRRDYNQQELRILAHFEDGDLLAHYLADPRFDHHHQVLELLKQAGHDYPRDSVKILNFQDIYGGGASALAEAIHCTVQEAATIKRAKRALLPDYAALEEAVKARGRAGLAIRTWGGREYYCEPSKYVKKFNRVMSFEYKLLNYLIQGSAADCTKESIIRYDEHPKKQGRFLISVHDENNICAPKKLFKQEMAVLRECMQSVEFDIPMLSDGEYGETWGALQPFKETPFDFATWKPKRKKSKR